jgi:hypothetical protein
VPVVLLSVTACVLFLFCKYEIGLFNFYVCRDSSEDCGVCKYVGIVLLTVFFERWLLASFAVVDGLPSLCNFHFLRG